MIKTFEQYNNKYYQKISKSELQEIPILDISDRVISKIKDLGLNIMKIKSPNILTSDGVRRVDIGYFKVHRDAPTIIPHIVSILQCEDYYFIVQFNENISVEVVRRLNSKLTDKDKAPTSLDHPIDYISGDTILCDEFDGLVQFLKDIKLINI